MDIPYQPKYTCGTETVQIGNDYTRTNNDGVAELQQH